MSTAQPQTPPQTCEVSDCTFRELVEFIPHNSPKKPDQQKKDEEKIPRPPRRETLLEL